MLRLLTIFLEIFQVWFGSSLGCVFFKDNLDDFVDWLCRVIKDMQEETIIQIASLRSMGFGMLEIELFLRINSYLNRESLV